MQQLINQEVHFITRLKAKASIKYLNIFSYDHSIKDRLIQLGTVRRGAPVLTLRLIEIKIGKTTYSYITSVSRPKRFLEGLPSVHLTDCIQSATMRVSSAF